MPIMFIPFLYTAILALILVATVPKNKIHRLSIYGIIFGALFDIVLVTTTNFFNEFGYKNYGPFGLGGIHFAAPVAWSIFFIMYFYFLPRIKTYVYIYIIVAILSSIAFCQMITKLGVLYLAHGIIDSIIPFLIWFPTATWGYYKLTTYFDQQQHEGKRSMVFIPHPQPARKILKRNK
ncbi:hypothetical protein SPSYN_02138 [Sporotomaculum syntrophicum]|uniref:Uncharacterized protein n=1 Tax=Sporotomaculum syntrophicum TaxID=182264 RepID=A0A9D2WMT9_9FIRM|nr:hypothetical protein [Sporotomaculum syntrophicum]KAF1084362.1 hypothetical protein SPSYN_02138 [Sporotomaculum syntrophicum]